MYFIQRWFICRSSDPTLSEDAGIEPLWHVAVRRSDLLRSTTKIFVSHYLFLSHISMFRSSITTGVGLTPLAAETKTTKPVRFVNGYPLLPIYSMSAIKVHASSWCNVFTPTDYSSIRALSFSPTYFVGECAEFRTLRVSGLSAYAWSFNRQRST